VNWVELSHFLEYRHFYTVAGVITESSHRNCEIKLTITNAGKIEKKID